jgi:hypothetical protein
VSVPKREYNRDTPFDNAKEKDVVFTRDPKTGATTNKSLPMISDGPFPLKERDRINVVGGVVASK